MRHPELEKKPLCEHGVELGALNVLIARRGGEARAAGCPECWPEFYEDIPRLPPADPALLEMLDPEFVQVERRLRSFFERRRSTGN